MSESPYLHCLYAEDVRQELNQQFSIIGVFQGGVRVSAGVGQLPKLAIVADLCLPRDYIPQGVKLEIVRGEEVLQSFETPQEFLANAMKQASALDDRCGYNMQLVTGFSALPVTTTCTINVRALVDGKVITGNALRIEVSEDATLRSGSSISH